MANINKIRISGTSYDIQDLNAPSVSSLTQSEYDNLPSTAKTSNTFFVITDAQAGDLTNYYTKTETDTLLGGKADTATTYTKTEVDTLLDDKADTATTYTKTETDNAITAATSTKQDTLVSGTNIKTINNESILGSGNIDIQGGGKAIEAGRGISITTGETADTVSFNLPISASSKSIGNYINIGVFYDFDSISATKFQNISIGSNNIAKSNTTIFHGNNNTSNGNGSFISGYHCQTNGLRSNAFGDYIVSNNEDELSTGRYNVSNKANSTFGNSGNTLFSVGNGTADNARHNAFEIRQNGDIYLSSGGTDIKLQDTITATAANTTALGGLKLVKLTQSAYDALSPNYDSNTLYVIVN